MTFPDQSVRIGRYASAEDRERFELAKSSCVAARFAGTFTLDRRRMKAASRRHAGVWACPHCGRGGRGGCISRIASVAATSSLRRAGLRFNVLPAAAVQRAFTVNHMSLTPSARLRLAARTHRTTEHCRAPLLRFLSLQHTLARGPLSGAAGSGRSRFDVFGVIDLERGGIDQPFPRIGDSP
jgi:ribosomal protein L37AE/L43A